MFVADPPKKAEIKSSACAQVEVVLPWRLDSKCKLSSISLSPANLASDRSIDSRERSS